MGASSDAIDFVTALGRLLRSGPLRDAFATDRAELVAHLRVRPGDRPALLQLDLSQLEFQAQVLLHKRFDTVQRRLPRTCAALSEDGWPAFHEFARAAEHPAEEDAWRFCAHLELSRHPALCPFERNRCHLLQQGRGWALRVAFASPVAGRARRPCVQLLLGGDGDWWHEWRISIGF